MNTQDKLNRLSDLQSQADVIRAHFEELRATILTPEIQAQLAEIDAEEQTSLTTLQGGVDNLITEIKADIIAGGASIKGNYLQAVWTKGRISWDTKALDGYAAAHPEITPFRKEGEPSVSIRAVKP
jgi:hypothetical protein